MSVSVYNNGELTPVAGQLLPAKTASFAGQIVMGANISTPAGWLKCDGTGYSKSDYVELYAAIGDTYNKPDTPMGYFCVPDMRGRYALGFDETNAVGKEIEESLPNIQSKVRYDGMGYFYTSSIEPEFQSEGAFYNAKGLGANVRTSGLAGDRTGGALGFDASRSNPAYKDGAKVRPDSLVLNYYIKY